MISDPKKVNLEDVPYDEDDLYLDYDDDLYDVDPDGEGLPYDEVEEYDPWEVEEYLYGPDKENLTTWPSA